ncbi:MAG TPA: hypothetical protein VGC10_09400 [Sphingomonas sp.]
MRPRNRAALALLCGVAALAVAMPVLGQQSPQSILPPGFGAPVQPAPVEPAAAPPAAPGNSDAPIVALTPPASGSASGHPDDAANAAEPDADNEDDAVAAKAAAALLRKQDIPEFARRPTDHVGFLSPAQTGIPADGFGTAHGAFLRTLMARLDAPIASRWLSMLLRRVLTTDIGTPGGVDPSDWVAERALLLTRMGEADAARLLIQRVDPDKATPRVDQAILEASLAAADPAGLCPVADQAEAMDPEPAWPLARAMCASLSGEGGTAGALADRARAMPGAMDGLDRLLAERIIGAGTNSRRATTIEWGGVDGLTSWRFGLASAAGLAIPDALINDAAPAMQAWSARAPMLPLASRIAASRTAATLGVFSAADLVDAYAAVAEGADPYATDQTPAGRLRTAYVAHDMADRVAALRALWADPESERDLYASRLMTARAAARIAPSADYASDAAALIAAMMSAGLDAQSARWADVARAVKGTAGDEAWALLAVGAPGRVVDVDADRVANFGEGGRGAAKLRAQLLFAGLAGLGRLAPRDVDALATRLDVPLTERNSWTRAIDAGAARREPATTILLAAVGMQTGAWSQVDPVFFYHIIAALRAVGYGPEARMIAAEALMRT